MTISQDVETRILRFYFAEKWPVGTIATQLGIHHTTVDRVLAQAGMPKAKRVFKSSIIDAYLPWITETLQQFPDLPASRLYAMAKERGYPGAESHFRHHIKQLRPHKQAEAYLRLKTLPGEQAQVDWAHFDHLVVGRAKRPLMAFVMVLSWSRRIFLRFYLNQQMSCFIRGHVAAFTQWQAVPRVLLYDNLKSAVLERQGDAIRYHPTLLSLAAHYRFEPRPVAVARGNEKGRVERAIRYIRGNFFAGRQWQDLQDLNQQADQWCAQYADQRHCPERPELTVGEAFLQEQPYLLALPDNPFEQDEVLVAKVGKTPYVRFDLNDYSVPHRYAYKSLTVSASEQRVRLLDGAEVVAEHPRRYDKGQQIENPEHIQALVERKRQARQHRGQDRLSHAVPLSQTWLVQAAQRGRPLGSWVATLLRLLDQYGAAELTLALEETLHKGSISLGAVHVVLQRRREQRDQPPPLTIAVPEKAQTAIKPPRLTDYDTLGKSHDQN